SLAMRSSSTVRHGSSRMGLSTTRRAIRPWPRNPATASLAVRIFVRMEDQNDRDVIIDAFRRAGFELLRPETIHPTDATPFFILTSENLEGPAFSHVLHFDAEMIGDHAD